MSAATLPRPLAAREPPEALGRARDDVALLVASRSSEQLVHARFHELGRFVQAGDLLVVNTSATLPAALPGRLEGRPVELRLSTRSAGDRWLVELRAADRGRYGRPPIGSRVELPAGGLAELLAPAGDGERLCLARLSLPQPVEVYLGEHGHAISYDHVGDEWPIEAYQTVFAREAGSAEMPSAARPFTAALVASLVSQGVLMAPVTLHTGVSSLERGEVPYPERYRVPAYTARIANAVHGWGGRIIAVGTTVVRALETVAAPDGLLAAGMGTTSLVVTPERGLWAVDGLLTGWHEPESSHLSLLEAAAGVELLERSYTAARASDYRWHEFGDAHLLIP
jgi:S-adenosylmethionine:tRNA ribosyltransferase-isomerase